jgi:transcriptional regulator with XRE-family HTH domain
MDAFVGRLARLLAEYRQRTGESYRVLEQRTGISRGWFSNIHMAKHRSYVEPEALRKMATGLCLPIADLVNAAIITAGYAELKDETPEARN